MLPTTRRGFSLIELLMVLAIIALLASVIFATMKSARMKARDSQRISNAHQLSLALEQYETTFGTYKIANAGYKNTGSGYVGKSGVTDYTNSIISGLKNVGFYSNDILKDPIFGDENYYLGVCPEGNRYNIYMKVEQPALSHSSSTLSGGCDAAGATLLGFNYLLGADGDGASGGTALGGGSGSGRTAKTWVPEIPLIYENVVLDYIAYGNGKYVAMGFGKTWNTETLSWNSEATYAVYQLPDATWSKPVVIDSGCTRYNNLYFQAGRFVAFPQRNYSANTCVDQIASSADGITWTLSNGPKDTYGYTPVPTGIAVSPTEMVAVAGGTIMTSNDGTSWTLNSNETLLRGVAYGAGKYVAIGGGNSWSYTMSSTDAVTWESDYTVPFHLWSSIAYGNGKFVAVAEDGAVMSSPDGSPSSWTMLLEPSSIYWKRIIFGGGLFSAAQSTDAGYGIASVVFSPDGVTWSKPLDISYIRGFTYAGTKFFQINSENIMSSED